MSHGDTPTIARAPAEGVRVSTVDGNRLCIRCGFNLMGQAVLREPVYGMLMVRCPECSTPASLQEYPLLGRWAARWAALLAGVWILALLLFLLFNSLVVMGWSAGVSVESGEKMAGLIDRAQRDWYATLDDAARKSVSANVQSMLNASGPSFWIDQGWWDSVDKPALLAGAGGWARALSWKAARDAPWLFLTGAMFGAVWSVVLLHVRRRRVMLLAPVPPALGAVLYFQFSNQGTYWMQGFIQAQEAAWQVVGWPVFYGALLLSTVGICAGVLAGRHLARWLSRTLLPPTMLGAVSFLWIADGRRPPRAAGRSRDDRTPATPPPQAG